MRLVDGESEIRRYSFDAMEEEPAQTYILTNRRLVLVSRNNEEVYPLSKITAVKTAYHREWRTAVAGTTLFLTGIALNKSFIRPTVRVISTILIAGGSVLVVLGAIIGWLGTTRVTICQPGGEKAFSARGRRPGLTEFIQSLTGLLT